MSKNEKKIKIYSALEVANICGVVNQTAINWIKNSHLKAFTTPGGQYRIYAEDLLEFLESRNMRIPDQLIEQTKSSDRKAIVIVDDDEDLNNMLREILVRKLPGYDIEQAFDGFEAGQLISDRRPAAIILDIDLPGINGHKLCAKIKKDKRLNNPVIVSISGLDEETEGAKIIQEGADAFISKPLDFDKLVGKLKDLI